MEQQARKWFVLNAGQVQGPFTVDEAEGKLAGAMQPLLWGRGLHEWVPPAEWRQAMQTLGTALTEAHHEDPQWRFQVNGTESGPFTYGQLIEELRKIPDYTRVEIASEGFTGWREIYGVQKIVDELGITRRAHPRVPIMGSLKVDSTQGRFDARIISISEGGLGLSEAPPLTIGERFKAVLSSPNLFQEINCTCEVVFIGGDGGTGLRFVHLPQEGLAAVIEYVNKFKDLGER